MVLPNKVWKAAMVTGICLYLGKSENQEKEILILRFLLFPFLFSLGLQSMRE